MDNSDHLTKADWNALRDDLIEAMRDIETKLLKAFYGFAESAQQRLNQNESVSDGLSKRIATVDGP